MFIEFPCFFFFVQSNVTSRNLRGLLCLGSLRTFEHPESFIFPEEHHFHSAIVILLMCFPKTRTNKKICKAVVVRKAYVMSACNMKAAVIRKMNSYFFARLDKVVCLATM